MFNRAGNAPRVKPVQNAPGGAQRLNIRASPLAFNRGQLADLRFVLFSRYGPHNRQSFVTPKRFSVFAYRESYHETLVFPW